MVKKKLLIFMPIMEVGGVEKNLINIANHLIKRFNKISLITLSNKFKNKFDKKIEFISFKSYFLRSFGKRKSFILCLYLLFLQILKNRNVVVLCFQGNIYCTFLCKLLGVRVIVRSNTSPDGWSKNFIKFIFYKYILGLADKIIVNSLDFKKNLKLKFNISSTCIYNPLDLKEVVKKSRTKQKIRLNKKKINLINVGRLVDQKDQMTLLKAVNRIKNQINFNLIIIGAGNKKHELIDYINRNNLNQKIQLIGSKNNPFNLISSSDIFILTSLYEGLPNVLLEAQALKTYIISTNCPTGPKEILLNGKAGSLFKVGNYKQLSKLILDYSKNRIKYLKMIRCGYQNLYRFDYKKNLNKYTETIKPLMK
tara:strand:- start:1136 stop:2233 length:1098 start_codon:yes stop_codon:yes gene_type:complete